MLEEPDAHRLAGAGSPSPSVLDLASDGFEARRHRWRISPLLSPTRQLAIPSSTRSHGGAIAEAFRPVDMKLLSIRSESILGGVHVHRDRRVIEASLVRICFSRFRRGLGPKWTRGLFRDRRSARPFAPGDSEIKVDALRLQAGCKMLEMRHLLVACWRVLAGVDFPLRDSRSGWTAWRISTAAWLAIAIPSEIIGTTCGIARSAKHAGHEVGSTERQYRQLGVVPVL